MDEATYKISTAKEGQCVTPVPGRPHGICGHSGAVHGSAGKICAGCACKDFTPADCDALTGTADDKIPEFDPAKPMRAKSIP